MVFVFLSAAKARKTIYLLYVLQSGSMSGQK